MKKYRITTWAGLLAGGVLALAGCGSEQSKMERGLTVDREEAVPSSDEELELTEAERRAREEKKEGAFFEEERP